MNRLLALGLMALALGACNRENRTPQEQAATTADTSRGYGTAAPAPVTPVQGPPTAETPQHAAAASGPLTATGNLVSHAKDAPRGTITVSQVGEGTQVLLKIDHYPAGSKLAAGLAAGSCNAQSPTVSWISRSFTIEPSGFATITDTIPNSTREILDGRHSIEVTTPGASTANAVLACADLPAVSG